jgi:hypothetical protein
MIFFCKQGKIISIFIDNGEADGGLEALKEEISQGKKYLTHEWSSVT